MASNRDRINSIMEQATGNSTDIFVMLYKEFLKNQVAPIPEFRSIAEGPRIEEVEDDVPESISVEKRKEAIYVYHRLVMEISHLLSLGNPSADDYYSELYYSIFESKLIPADDSIRGVILEMISQHLPEIPYVQLSNPLYMSEEEYQHYSELLTEQKSEVLYILRRNLNTKTEILSQIYDISERLPDRTQRIVFWTNVIDLLKNNSSEE